jgi:hypothetical protein
MLVVGQFEIRNNTPKAFANFSPGLGQPWVQPSEIFQTLKGLIPHMPNAFSVNVAFLFLSPKVVAVLQPWAEISQRLRRIPKFN